MSNIVAIESAKLPSFLKAIDPQVLASELTANVGGGGFPVMSIKGKVFALVKGGERETLMNPNDTDEVATSINVVTLKANSGLSKVWYAKNFVEGSDAKPDCFSHDGVAPDPSVESPQSKKCSICPKNQWGSKVSEDGKKMKACADSRRLAIANPDELDDPILLRAPAATLKPLAEYGESLAKRGVPYNAVVTKIGFDREAASPKLTFKAISFVSEEQFAQIQNVVDEDTVASILGKHGDAPVVESAAVEEEIAGTPPKAAVKETPAEKPKAKVEKKAAVSKDEVGDVLGGEPDAPKVEAKVEKKAEKAATVKVAENLEDELDSLLGELDD